MKFFTTEEMVCTNCGSRGFPKKITKGSFLIELVLWLCFFIPGLIYSCWRVSSRYEACPNCKAPNMLPFNSPRAQDILKQTSNTVKHNNREITVKIGRGIGRGIGKGVQKLKNFVGNRA